MYYICFDIAKENHYASIANSYGKIIQEAFFVKNSINGFNFFPWYCGCNEKCA